MLNGIEPGAEVRLGFVPGGGTSVLPRALGLPRDALAAARRLREAVRTGTTRRISLGRVNGRRFAFNAGIGFDAEAVRRFDSLGRGTGGKRPGDARFLLTIAEMLWDHRFRYDAVAELDGAGPVAFAIACNCDVLTYVGPRALRIAPHAVRARARRPRPGRRQPARGAAARRLSLQRARERFAATTCTTSTTSTGPSSGASRPVPLQADGEDLGDVEHVLFESERDAVTVLV